jgi:hypothetical protein
MDGAAGVTRARRRGAAARMSSAAPLPFPALVILLLLLLPFSSAALLVAEPGSAAHEGGRLLQGGPPSVVWYLQGNEVAGLQGAEPETNEGEDGARVRRAYFARPLARRVLGDPSSWPRRMTSMQAIGNLSLILTGPFRVCNATPPTVPPSDVGYLEGGVDIAAAAAAAAARTWEWGEDDLSCSYSYKDGNVTDKGLSLRSDDAGLTWRRLQWSDDLLLRAETATVSWDPAAAAAGAAGTDPTDLAPALSACQIGGIVYQTANGSALPAEGRYLLPRVPTRNVMCFNHTTQLWESQAPLPLAITHTAAVFFKGRVYTFGGRVSLSDPPSPLGISDTEGPAPVFVGTLSPDGYGIVSWRAAGVGNPAAYRFSLAAVAWSGARVSDGPVGSTTPIIIPPSNVPAILLIGGQPSTRPSLLRRAQVIAANETNSSDTYIRELYAQVPVWCVLNDPADDARVQLNFPGAVQKFLAAAEAKDAETAAPADADADAVSAGAGSGTEEGDDVAAESDSSSSSSLSSSSGPVARLMRSRAAADVNWYHMIGYGLPEEALSSLSGSESTPSAFKINGNFTRSSIGTITPPTEFLCVLYLMRILCSGDAGSTFALIQNTFSRNTNIESTMSFIDTVGHLVQLRDRRDGFPFFLAIDSTRIYRSFLRVCDFQCPSGYYGIGCVKDPWDTMCVPCGSCIDTIEIPVKRCSSGKQRFQNSNVVCARCSACAPNETFVAYCNTTAGKDTVCAPRGAPPAPLPPTSDAALELAVAIANSAASLTVDLSLVGATAGITVIIAFVAACMRASDAQKRREAVAAARQRAAGSGERAGGRRGSGGRSAGAAGAGSGAGPGSSFDSPAEIILAAASRVIRCRDILRVWLWSIIQAVLTVSTVALQVLAASTTVMALESVGKGLDDPSAAALPAASVLGILVLHALVSGAVTGSLCVRARLAAAGAGAGAGAGAKAATTAGAAEAAEAGASVEAWSGAGGIKVAAGGKRVSTPAVATGWWVAVALVGALHPRLLGLRHGSPAALTVSVSPAGHRGLHFFCLRESSLYLSRILSLIMRDLPISVLLAKSPLLTLARRIAVFASMALLILDVFGLIFDGVFLFKRSATAKAHRDANGGGGNGGSAAAAAAAAEVGAGADTGAGSSDAGAAEATQATQLQATVAAARRAGAAARGEGRGDGSASSGAALVVMSPLAAAGGAAAAAANFIAGGSEIALVRLPKSKAAAAAAAAAAMADSGVSAVDAAQAAASRGAAEAARGPSRAARVSRAAQQQSGAAAAPAPLGVPGMGPDGYPFGFTPSDGESVLHDDATTQAGSLGGGGGGGVLGVGLVGSLSSSVFSGDLGLKIGGDGAAAGESSVGTAAVRAHRGLEDTDSSDGERASPSRRSVGSADAFPASPIPDARTALPSSSSLAAPFYQRPGRDTELVSLTIDDGAESTSGSSSGSGSGSRPFPTRFQAPPQHVAASSSQAASSAALQSRVAVDPPSALNGWAPPA